MRGRVLASVRARLRAAGVRLDGADLEACYSQAWHGLYTTMLDGDDVGVANPEGWLVLVTYRRAIDEHRSRVRTAAYAATPTAAGDDRAGDPAPDPRAPERDLAGELDDRARLRQLMEGLRGRLSPRERQAAALCYLQGRSRAEAATRMGISEARMRKLMDGRPGSPGVAGKVGELLQSIRAGSYCAEQSSLMRGFAFGILDPDGERYALAMAHQRECSACRAHVLSLRGLAAVLPPLPLPLVLGAGAVAGAGATTGVGASAGTGAGVGAGTGVSAGVGAGGAAGGGWLLASGGVGAKLAVGCLLAVSVGAGCVALSIVPFAPHHPAHRRHAVHAVAAPRGGYEALSAAPVTALPVPVGVTSRSRAGASTSASATTAAHALTPAARAGREFGLEQPARPAAATAQSSVSHIARVASAGSGETGSATGAESSGSSASSPGDPVSGGGTAGHESGGPSSASREFGLG